MSSLSSPLLRLEIKPSRWRLMLAMCGLLVVTLWPWFISFWPRPVALSLSLTLMIGALFWLRHASHPSRRLIRVVWQSSGSWLLGTADGVEHLMELDHRSWVTRNLLILRWHCGKQRMGFTIMRPELTGREWRLWQIRLRLEAGHPGTKEQRTSG